MLRSWYCGKKVAYDFCYDGSEVERCRNGNGMSGAGAGYNPDLGGGNGKVSSIRIYPYDVSQEGGITIFGDPDCSGRHGRLSAGTDQRGFVDYSKSTLYYNNIYNDWASAATIPLNYSI